MKKKVIFHVDMDAFFAAVEQADYPEYRGKPVIIGARPGHRGVVSACSYEARKYGIHSAMPISQAYRKCPQGVYLPVRMKRYQEISAVIMGILKTFTPLVYQVSVDEAFMDLTGTERLFGLPRECGKKIKNRIFTHTGLTISIGIASNFFLAKLASDFKKPDGLYLVEEGEPYAFLDKLKLKELWGVGEKTLTRLADFNITTVPQLRELPHKSLTALMGKANGNYLYNIARGIDPGIYSFETENRSISHEITFETDTTDRNYLKQILLSLSHQVMFRLLNQNYKAKTVTLKLRYHDFSTKTIQKTLGHFIGSSDEVYSIALLLMEQKWDRSTPLRLIGVGLSSIQEPGCPVQQELFQEELGRKSKVEQAVLKIRKKHSNKSIIKASLLDKKKKPDSTLSHP